MTSASIVQQPEKFAYRPREVAAVIGIGLTKTRALIASGAIKSVRIGKCIVVTPEAIREFLAGTAAVRGGR